MNPDRWRRVEEIYHHVLSCPAEQRLAVLESSCSDDPELRREIESLLTARDGAGNQFLATENLYAHLSELTAEPLVGKKLGSYEIQAAIGAGAMGEVYRARDSRLGRDVALKVLPAHVTHDPARVSRFRMEAKAASALNHSNIVTIHEIGEDKGRWFIAAELIEGSTLRQKKGKTPIEDVLAIGLQCANALAASHSAGVVHRDIKPENIMLRPDGVAKVVDFGLARITEVSGISVEATQTGSILGTPRYMSPEQARGQKPDARSDIFSLGAVLYELAAGAPAFRGQTTAEVFASLLTSNPDLSQAGPLGSVLGRALAKDPEQRYRTMAEFAEALRSFHPARLRFIRMAKSAVAASVAVAAAAAVYGWMTRLTVREQAIQVAPLATFSGAKSYPAISPNGARVAFSWRAPGSKTAHIYTKPVGEGDAVQLTSAAFDDVTPTWSPDGQQIAFARQTQADEGFFPQEVFVMPANGGTQRKVAVTWRGVSWSPDGKTLALTRVPGEQSSAGGVYLLSLASGETRDLTVSQQDSFPIWAPDGKWIGFKRLFSGKPAQMFVIRSEGGTPKQITFDPLQPIRAATWTPDSREIIFASLRSGLDGSLWRVNIGEGAPRPVSAILRDASDPNISSKGSLAYREEWIDSNVYLIPTDLQNAPAEVVDSSREDHSPSFSRDGERIAFVSERSGHLEIWTANRDGSHPTQLTKMMAQNTGTPRWSPDGSQIAFDSWAGGASGIYVVDAKGGKPKQLTSGPVGSWMPAWSPDGQWLYFSRGVAGASDIWKMPASGGEPIPLTRHGGFESFPSPDGSLVYYSKTNSTGGRSLWSVPAAGGDERAVPELAQYNNIGRSWGVARDGIFFASYEDGRSEQTVRFFSFETRKIAPLLTLQKQMRWGIGSLAMSWDGRFVLATQLDHAVNNLMRIDNFR